MTDLRGMWLSLSVMPWDLKATGHIRRYFGEKVAMYFGFLGSLALWLIVPSIFGTVVFIRSKYVSDNIGEVVFGLFMTLWATLFLENWKRQQATFAMKWGMEGAMHT